MFASALPTTCIEAAVLKSPLGYEGEDSEEAPRMRKRFESGLSFEGAPGEKFSENSKHVSASFALSSSFKWNPT